MVTLNQRLQKQSSPNRTIRSQYKQMGPQPNLGKLDPQKEHPKFTCIGNPVHLRHQGPVLLYWSLALIRVISSCDNIVLGAKNC